MSDLNLAVTLTLTDGTKVATNVNFEDDMDAFDAAMQECAVAIRKQVEAR